MKQATLKQVLKTSWRGRFFFGGGLRCGLIPAQARSHMEDAMRKNGVAMGFVGDTSGKPGGDLWSSFRI